MKRCPILFGFGTVENAYHQTCVVKALHPEDIYEGEKKLLVIAKERMASIPFDEIDILIVDQIGKDISGMKHFLLKEKDLFRVPQLANQLKIQ